jgi:hypothetical protein
MLKQLGTNIYNFFSSPVPIALFSRIVRVTLFSICVLWLGPWVWANKLDPAITENASYLEFLCATLLCWMFIQNMVRPTIIRKKKLTEDEWFIED